VHNYHALTSLGALAAAPARPPVVLTPHYMGPGDGQIQHVVHRAFATGMRRALHSTRRVISTTRSEAEAFASQVHFPGPFTIIPNGVDAAAIRAAQPVTTGGGRLLVTAGRFEEYKQHQLLVESLALLPPDHRLALVGAGPMEHVLRQRVTDLRLTDRVLFPGRLSAGELYRWFRSADVVVSLSRREGFGLTLAEGLAAGAAVVASDIGPHRDVMELAGVSEPDLVPVRARPEEVAAAITAARRPPEGTGSRLPDWDDVAAATLACYEEVVRD
jgi:glycosyltransferase involved in cell wall biosynthesis